MSLTTTTSKTSKLKFKNKISKKTIKKKSSDKKWISALFLFVTSCALAGLGNYLAPAFPIVGLGFLAIGALCFVYLIIFLITK